ncbi:MAG: polysaccharide deacetylase family protein [Firmicutes bacterium]|nr:polysaccharide deacetylase family protein [Bacillota bacterium]
MKKLLLLLIPVLLIGALSGATPASINWGLSHNKNNLPPSPPTRAARLLKEHNGLFVGDTSKKEIFLTFDLGYEEGYTNEVLDILKTNNIKAIFFLCGNYLKEEELVNRMLSEGHIIGNHTNKHLSLPKYSDERIRQDIVEFDQMYKSKYKGELKHFRPPSGKICERTLRIANEENLKTIMWSNAIVDWHKKPIDPIKSSNKLASRLHNGSIVLLHIANSGMPKTLELFIDIAKKEGYVFGDATLL